MTAHRPRNWVFPAGWVASLLCVFVLSSCAHDEDLPDFGLLPAGYSVVLAAPASRFLPTRSMLFGHARDVPEPVAFRFRRVGRPDEPPVYLELIGTADQSVRLYAAPPGTYRLVEAYLLSQPWRRRWSFERSPDVLEVREGEAVYVGTLLWRDYWVDVVNDEAEARAIYDKRIQAFKSRSLTFVTRLVRTTEHAN